VLLSLVLSQAGVTDESAYDLALSILVPMGEYFQVQDDVLDAFAEPEALGKIGTDILDNKCSWPINLALSLASPEQRATLDASYGIKDAEAEARVKAIYRDLDIQGRFDEYEKESYAKLNALIEGVDEKATGLKKEVFRSFLEKVYKRTK
jgi:farnesyl diphosphate synthase